MATRDKLRLAARLTGELFVIVLGVLVALGVDGWADGQAERERERVALVTLRSDLQASVDELRRDNASTRSRSEMLRWFHGFPAAEAGRFPADSLPRVLTALNITEAYYPILRTYDALVATGSLGLIRNEAIQFGLADIQRLSDQYLDYRKQTTDQWLMTLMPIYLTWFGNSTTLPPPDVDGALQDREMAGAISMRATFLAVTALYGRTLADRMDEVIALVDAELGPSGQ
jgi:hypothetical protein